MPRSAWAALCNAWTSSVTRGDMLRSARRRVVAGGLQRLDLALQLDRELDDRREVGLDAVAHLEQQPGALVEPGLDHVEPAVHGIRHRPARETRNTASKLTGLGTRRRLRRRLIVRGHRRRIITRQLICAVVPDAPDARALMADIEREVRARRRAGLIDDDYERELDRLFDAVAPPGATGP